MVSFSIRRIFTRSLKEYPFKGGGCYLLLGTVEVDYHFPDNYDIQNGKDAFYIRPPLQGE